MASVGSGNDAIAVPNFHALSSKIGFQIVVVIDKTSSFLSACEQCIIHYHVNGSRGRLVQYL